MPYAKIETKFSGPGEELTSEPSYKKLKSTTEACVFPHHDSADFHKIQQKTGNNWVPVAVIDVRRHSYPEEDKTQTTDLLKPVHDETPGNKLDVIESTGSQVLQSGNPPLVSTDDEIYSTSKAFIGPIYKPPEKKKFKERNQTNTLSGINGKGTREEKQKFNAKKPEIDTELSQFYKEIEELENEKDDSEESICKELESSQEQVIPCYQRYSTDILKSDDIKELCTTFQAQCDYQQYLENELGHYSYDEQEIPTFCDISFTSFRPEWQSMHPFIVPHGPPLPSFNYHLNIPRFSTSPNLPPNIFPAQDNSLMRSGYYEDSCHDNWDCLTFDQSNEYTVTENGSNVHPSRNGYSVQDGYMRHDFYEIRQGFWKDSIDKYSETHRFVNQQFQEEKLNKLQKLLILLRGLPGSGKTTLSRILLGQSRDGIVFSTDDYFHHQDGYRYNVNQLGDAHDWNQNRAKQAIDQGRSPVIIDNTNTQAWEMKPYVEMAIGKGYRVEFHEPETWWKFDPEELEKRNKHGVSRKKIAQMLDRYEYQMSISIVMNSVEPTQKSTQRLTPPQGSQREGILRKTGFRLSKAKQKRNRKRNKKSNSLCEIADENSLETCSYLTTEAQYPFQNEEDIKENKTVAECLFISGRQNACRELNGCKEKNLEDSFESVVSTVELYNTPKNFSKGDDELILISSSMSNKSSGTWPIGTQNLPCVTKDDCSGIKVEKHKDNRFTMALNMKNSFASTPCPFLQKIEVDQRLLNEPIEHYQHGSRASENILREEQGVHASKNNYWAFLTNNLSDEELQLGSDRQPYFDSWPEGPHKFVCEQRPKKDRSHKLACPDSKEQLIKLISTSEGISEPGSRQEILIDVKLLVEDEDLSPITETIAPFRDTETNNFRSCLPQLDNPKSASVNEKRWRKIFNLVPNFSLLGQSLTNTKEKEKHSLLTESHALNNILGEEKDKNSEVNNKEEKKQKLMTCNDKKTSLFHFDIFKDSPLNIGGKFYFPYLSFNRLGHAMYLYKNPLPSFVLHYISSFWMIPFTSKKTFLTFKSQTRVRNTLTDVDFIFSEILCSQPDTLCSLRITSDTQVLNERSGEKLKKLKDSKSLQCLPTENHHDLRLDSFWLPLPQRFAFQLVKLFGPPGIPLESLLPDDYVIPLDWKTLKMIYLQWKITVEKRQKKIG
ncbi:uncharacterized protein LOC122112540 isoform X2 [Dipodomys spectabilis]|uniref:uncharacterized protein LOC122112540 isoform X2 n=1 Tax=Dipodomys spectabilis TaxID=105255 RepID=UPI001C537633|nr:uncharacterized protein LOC122112540 isoform X2 [Dipodomys spectabilis]